MIKLIVIIAIAFAAWSIFAERVIVFDPKTGSDSPRKPIFIALAVLALLVLAGCSTTSSRDRALIAASQASVALPVMADSELTCAAEPSSPMPANGSARVRESQVVNYILDLREAGADCRDKLGVVRRVWRKVEEVRSRAVPPVTEGEKK